MRVISEEQLEEARNNVKLDWDTRRAIDIVLHLIPLSELQEPWMHCAVSLNKLKGGDMEEKGVVHSSMPAIFVTGMQVSSGDGVFRVAFVERIVDSAPIVERCAVVMGLDTAKGLRDLLDQHITHKGE